LTHLKTCILTILVFFPGIFAIAVSVLYSFITSK